MWVKLVAGMGVVIAVLLAFIGYRTKKIEKLEHKEKINEKIKEIRKDQDESKRRILKEEKERVNEKVNKAIPDNDNTGDLDDYLDGL